MGSAALDLTHLSTQAGGDKVLMGQVLHLFLDHATTVLDALAAAPDAKTWRDQAHALKGSAKGVGCWAVAEAAQVAEQQPMDTGTIPAIREAFSQARLEILRFQPAS